MPLETLYKPKGAGHEAPEDRRRNYDIPQDSWVGNVFLDWLDEAPETGFSDWFGIAIGQYYGKTLEEMPDLTGVTVDGLHKTLSVFDEHPNIRSAGLFLSAAYKKMGADVVIFDADTEVPINCLGYDLDWGTKLVIYSNTGVHTGWWNKGTIVNWGKSKNLGENSSGTIFNFGEVNHLGELAPGITINCGKAKSMVGDDTEDPVRGTLIALNDPEYGFNRTKRTNNIIRRKDLKWRREVLNYMRGMKRMTAPKHPREVVEKNMKGIENAYEDMRPLLWGQRYW